MIERKAYEQALNRFSICSSGPIYIYIYIWVTPRAIRVILPIDLVTLDDVGSSGGVGAASILMNLHHRAGCSKRECAPEGLWLAP